MKTENNKLTAAERAEIHICRSINTRMNSPIYNRAMAEVIKGEQEAEKCRALVREWAQAVGCVGSHRANVRKGRIQKLIKHGLNSAYADKIRKEIELKQIIEQ